MLLYFKYTLQKGIAQLTTGEQKQLMTPSKKQHFRRIVWAHYRKNARDFPWRETANPYHILVSEIMLQQTQVERVERFYKKFLKRFPTVRALAKAPQAAVLKIWQGLGYNRRAVSLCRLARAVVQKHQGRIPGDVETLLSLPGVGQSTAGAVLAYAYNKPAVFIETNIRSVFIHHFFPRRKSVHDREILELIEETMVSRSPRLWYWALMDYGAHLKKKYKNPNRKSASYKPPLPFAGSDRQLRGQVVKLLLNSSSQTAFQISSSLTLPTARLGNVLENLKKDGMIRKRGNRYYV